MFFEKGRDYTGEIFDRVWFRREPMVLLSRRADGMGHNCRSSDVPVGMSTHAPNPDKHSDAPSPRLR